MQRQLIVILLVGSVAGGQAAKANSNRPSQPPNVIIILTDDQGSVDAGCYGATDLRTPSIDALARTGVRFQQFYAAAPVCSPSRAGLHTGRYPIRAGVPGNVSSARGKAGMPTTQVTLAEVFRENGYATAHVGKWHLGYSEATIPNGQGFTYSFGHMGGCIDNYSHYFYWNGPNRHDLWQNGVEVQRPGRYFPDLMVEEATQFIETHRDQPFFLYFAMNTPHYPYQGSPLWLEYYKDLPYPRNLYAAFVSTLDQRIGALVRCVDELGLSEETIIVFQSDHGHSTELRAHQGGGSAGPYRGAKFSLFEGGIRVPAIIRWPGHLPEDEVRDQLAHGTDWFPTLLELAGISANSFDLDGMSLVPLLQNPEAASPERVTHWQVGEGEKAQWAVRRGQWKLIGNPRDTSNPGLQHELGGRFLADLEADVSESKNLVQQHPELVQELERLHQNWIESLRLD